MIIDNYKGTKQKGNMKKFSLLFGIMFFSIMLLSLSSASLGQFGRNECVDIRVLANCSSINLIEVNDGQVTYNISSAMTHISGQTFAYSFCNTSRIGTYSYSWDNSCIDCATNDCGNSFEVTNGNAIFYIILAAILVLIIILGFSIQEEWFVILGGLGLMMLGIYSINYGVAGFRDMFMTWGIGLFEIGTGFILAIKGSFELFKD